MGIADVLKEGRAKRTSLSALTAEAQEIVREMARAEASLKEAKAAREAVVEKAKAFFERTGIEDLEGPDGKVQVIVARGSRRLDLKMVRKMLSQEQLEEATVVGKSTTKVKFTPREKVLTEVK